MRGLLLAVLLLSAFSELLAGSADALERLLNLRTAQSPLAYSEAVETVRREAEAGSVLQQYVLALVSQDAQAPQSAHLSEKTRQQYLDRNRPRIRKLAETKDNALAWYLLSMEKNDLELLR